MQLYLIRHAQSQNNALPEEERVEDPGLTELGHQQAEALGKWIPSLNLTRLITSPFRRTLLTTEPIRRATGLVPEVRIDLHEQGGCYAGHDFSIKVGRPGMTRGEIEAEFSGYRVADNIDGEGWWQGKPYESWEAARVRAMRLLEATRREFAHTNERVAFVMHADIKRLFLSHLDTDPLDVPCNTSVTEIEFSANSTVLRQFNRIEHLPNHMITR
ncbi:MAG TPA: histidine phosphatase family protein [Pirellulaceae bacterium]|nr:histidine phosphatase family protein [Pirellulaceae bacterium]